MIYKRFGETSYRGASLEPDIYAEAIDSMIIVCVDIAFIKTEERTIYLARRIREPAKGEWFWMGGRMFVGESPEEGAERIAKRELHLRIERRRLVLRTIYEHIWPNRSQPPGSRPSHSIAFTFTYEATNGEISSALLDPEEYNAKEGLHRFSWDARADLPPMIAEMMGILAG